MELVEKCKQAIKDNELDKAGKYWNQIFEKYCPSAEIVKADSKKANEMYENFNKLMENFTDKEVYTVTDYLREKSYREEGLI